MTRLVNCCGKKMQEIIDNKVFYIGTRHFQARNGFSLTRLTPGTILKTRNNFLFFRPLNQVCVFPVLKKELAIEENFASVSALFPKQETVIDDVGANPIGSTN